MLRPCPLFSITFWLCSLKKAFSSQLLAFSELYSPPSLRRGQGWLAGTRHTARDPTVPLRVFNSGPLFSTTFWLCSGDFSCSAGTLACVLVLLSRKRHPGTMNYPGAWASRPQLAWNCGANRGQDARAPRCFRSGWQSHKAPSTGATLTWRRLAQGLRQPARGRGNQFEFRPPSLRPLSPSDLHS